MQGDGMVSFGVRPTTDFRNLKAATKIGFGRVTRAVIARSGRVKATSPAAPWKVTGIVLPSLDQPPSWSRKSMCQEDRKSTRLNSSHVRISYAVFCLKKKKHTSAAESCATTQVQHVVYSD